MRSFFKTEEIVIDGVTLTLRELSAGDSARLAGKNATDLLEVVCSLCVVEWKGEPPEAIRENVPVRIMREIADKVFALSGGDAKNSEPTPSADSSSV